MVSAVRRRRANVPQEAVARRVILSGIAGTSEFGVSRAIWASGLSAVMTRAQKEMHTFCASDVAIDQAPAVVLDHDKHIQQTKGRGYGDEEIAGNDPLSVQA